MPSAPLAVMPSAPDAVIPSAPEAVMPFGLKARKLSAPLAVIPEVFTKLTPSAPDAVMPFEPKMVKPASAGTLLSITTRVSTSAVLTLLIKRQPIFTSQRHGRVKTVACR